jgi:hypothetical protein
VLGSARWWQVVLRTRRRSRAREAWKLGLVLVVVAVLPLPGMYWMLGRGLSVLVGSGWWAGQALWVPEHARRGGPFVEGQLPAQVGHAHQSW